jgi:alpha-L-rhamnosidase
MSHGWGSNVLVEILRGVLGVAPTDGGWATFSVSPPTTGLTSASGRIPTPRGAVSVAWQRPAGAGGAWTVGLTVPPNAVATLTLPAATVRSVTEAGRSVGHDAGVRVVSVGGGDVVLSVGAGSYQFRAG